MEARILIVDDSPLLRSAIRRVIEHNPEWSVCGEAPDGQIAVELTEQLSPDLIVMDLAMPYLNGFEATQQIKSHHPDTPVLLCSLHWSSHLAEQAQNAGVSGAVSKSEGLTHNLMVGITALLKRETFFPAA
jgi:DNA-binding NarL/FixJ family response regulator